MINPSKKAIFLAPIAGVSDMAFRKTCCDFGAELTFTEMISAKALTYKDKRTFEMLKTHPLEGPVSVQLFGHEPEIMKEAAKIVTSLGQFSSIDINMGCPAPKIVKNGEGSALLLDLPLAGRIIESVMSGSTLPVSVKMRRGFASCPDVCIEAAKMAEGLGASFVTLHGRTREQFYAPKADWEIIRRLKGELKIPVIGNGDIYSASDAKRMLDETGCDGVMIARGAFGNPFIFKETKSLLKNGFSPPPVSLDERFKVALSHFRLLFEVKPALVAKGESRKHMIWYLKGARNAAAYRNLANKIESFSDIEDILSKALKEGGGA